MSDLKKSTPMKVESTGWIHDVPLQPADYTVLKILIGLGVLAAFLSGGGDEPNYWGVLAILGMIAVALMVGSLFFSAVKPKVNICPECNFRTVYNPHQKFCRCGYRPERT